MSSFARILPFVKPLEHLLLDPSVTEVMVNCGGRHVFVERAGTLEEVHGLVLEERNLKVAIKNIARTCGDEVSDAQPILDARLEDGSRVAAMFPPCSVNGPTLTIRKFTHRYTLEELVDLGTLTAELAATLTSAVRSQRNVLISGGTGTGKTTLLNALAATIPDQDETREGDVYRKLLEKLEEARKALGGQVFDVLGKLQFDGRALCERARRRAHIATRSNILAHVKAIAFRRRSSVVACSSLWSRCV
ncbi:MAG TPA: ATPase, T2SS/T4P/T4SS family [Vicinamibacterales bacterium]|nr:ATPase, T2SS/T4P/T4SS family [Vicinamibacterales bacterium]